MGAGNATTVGECAEQLRLRLSDGERLAVLDYIAERKVVALKTYADVKRLSTSGSARTGHRVLTKEEGSAACRSLLLACGTGYIGQCALKPVQNEPQPAQSRALLPILQPVEVDGGNPTFLLNRAKVISLLLTDELRQLLVEAGGHPATMNSRLFLTRNRLPCASVAERVVDEILQLVIFPAFWMPLGIDA